MSVYGRIDYAQNHAITHRVTQLKSKNAGKFETEQEIQLNRDRHSQENEAVSLGKKQKTRT